MQRWQCPIYTTVHLKALSDQVWLRYQCLSDYKDPMDKIPNCNYSDYKDPMDKIPNCNYSDYKDPMDKIPNCNYSDYKDPMDKIPNQLLWLQRSYG